MACTRRGGHRSTTEGARARAERTANIAYMVVTLEVSKLSGWLNIYAFREYKLCRE